MFFKSLSTQATLWFPHDSAFKMFKQTALLWWKQSPKFLASCYCTVSKEPSYLNDQQREIKSILPPQMTPASVPIFLSSPIDSCISCKNSWKLKKKAKQVLNFSWFALLSSHMRLLWKKHPSFLYCCGQHMRVPLPVLQGLSFLRAYLHCHESLGNHLSHAVSPNRPRNKPIFKAHILSLN